MQDQKCEYREKMKTRKEQQRNDEYVTRQEHIEFKEGLKQEDQRQNARILILEKTVRQINDLTLSVQKLATNMESMLLKQMEQGRRLEELEKQDGEMWREAKRYIVMTLIGAVIGYCLNQIGL